MATLKSNWRAIVCNYQDRTIFSVGVLVGVHMAPCMDGYFTSLAAQGLSAVRAVACSCPSSSHAGMLPDGIARFGR
jgi:hypothetical protein